MRAPPKILVGLVLAVLASAAFAEDGAVALSRVVNVFFDTAKGVASDSPFISDGKMIYGALLAIMIAWAGVSVMLEGSGFNGALAKLIKVIMMAGIATFFLSADTQSRLVAGFDYFAGKAVQATGANFDMSNPASGILSVAQQGLKSVKQMWSGKESERSTNTGSTGDAAEKSTGEKIKAWLNEVENKLSPSALVAVVMEGVAKVAISIVMLITYCIFIAVMVMSQILVNLGLFVAPLFIPWLMWESSAFLFHGWLKFVIVAGMQKIVAAAMFGLTLKLLDAVGSLSDTAAASPVFDEFSYLVALLLCLVSAYMMWQTSSIATGLVSGLPSTAMRFNLPKRDGSSPKPQSQKQS